jgi:S1-C subfamily serine protease
VTRSALAVVAVASVTAVVAGCAPDPPSAAVGIVVEACDPGTDLGSGAFVAPGIVLTAAHTLRGAERVEIVRNDERADASVVGFDPELDLAYLQVDSWPVVPIEVGSDHVERGDSGTAWVHRDGEIVGLPVTIVRRVRIDTEDIYVEGETSRSGFELRADIDPGDSGGAVVVDGQVVGVLWARSRTGAGRAYAIDPDRSRARIDRQLATGDLGDVDLTRCD